MQGTYQISVVTPPAVEPVTVAEVRSQLRATSTAQDTYIGTLIEGAREWVEMYLGRSLCTQDLLLELPCFAHRMYLPRGPVQSVTTLNYVDQAGAEQTVASSVYLVQKPKGGPAYVELGYNQTWPVARAQSDAIRITYRAGYPSTNSPADPSAGVPEIFKNAIKQLVQADFDDLRAEDLEALQQLIRSKLSPFRLLTF